MKKLLVAPHNDDEVLWTSFTILRERPLVLIVYDSFVQERRGNNVTAIQRRGESRLALCVLSNGKHPIQLEFLGANDADPGLNLGLLLERYKDQNFDEVWVPAVEHDGHHQHNLVGAVGLALWPNATRYLTYTTAGKSTKGLPVPIHQGSWVALKLRALACYTSQIEIERLGCREHFLRDQREYYAQ